VDGDFRLGAWLVAPKLNTLSLNGRTVRLEPKVMQVLVCLAASSDVTSKEKLMRTVWADTFVTDDVLTRSISELRKVFEDDPKKPRFIQTIPKGGYRLLVPAREAKLPEPQSIAPVAAPAPDFETEKPERNLLPFAIVGLIVLLLIAYTVGRHFSQAASARTSPSSPVSGKPILAVLPFQNLSNDPQQEYFADGLTAEMISQFGRLPSDRLGVIAWISMRRYKGTKKSEDEIGEELGANYLLEGTVRRSNDKVRITAELIRAGDRSHVWANSYDGDLSDVLALQSRVAREIANEIRLQLTPQEEEILAKQPTITIEGYDAYLKGKFLNKMDTPESFLQEIQHFLEAIRLNPSYAPAYVGLAMGYRMLASRGFAPPKETYAKALEAIRKALELDPGSAEAHHELGFIEWRYEWNFREADKEFKRALELSPDDAAILHSYSLYLKSIGNFEEASKMGNRGLAISPLDSFAHTNHGTVLALLGRYDDAMQEFKGVITKDPGNYYVYERMGAVLLWQGRKQEAIAAFEKSLTLSGVTGEKLAWLGYAYAVSGRRDEALQIRDQLDRAPKQNYVSPFYRALLETGLGNRDEALAWLQRAYDARDEWMVYLRIYPEFNSLRSDPRFQDIDHRMGFPSWTRRSNHRLIDSSIHLKYASLPPSMFTSTISGN
jgi:TolB-like protein/DNA-binding winged helix-turn-helix (wHTH) protein/Tfp pilus assembly protein PilF